MKNQTISFALGLLGLSVLTAKADFDWRPVADSNSGATTLLERGWVNDPSQSVRQYTVEIRNVSYGPLYVQVFYCNYETGLKTYQGVWYLRVGEFATVNHFDPPSQTEGGTYGWTYRWNSASYFPVTETVSTIAPVRRAAPANDSIESAERLLQTTWDQLPDVTKRRLRPDQRRWIKHKDDMDDPNDRLTCINTRIALLQSQSR
jgi:hypothetical protein